MRLGIHVHEFDRAGEPFGKRLVDCGIGDSRVDGRIPDHDIEAVLRLEAREELAAIHFEMQTFTDCCGLDPGQRLQFALGDETAVRLDDHVAPVAGQPVDTNGRRLERNGAAAFQWMDVEAFDLHDGNLS